MTPAGVRLYIFNSTTKLPDELVVPLLEYAKEVDEQEWGRELTGDPESPLVSINEYPRCSRCSVNSDLDRRTSHMFIDHPHYYHIDLRKERESDDGQISQPCTKGNDQSGAFPDRRVNATRHATTRRKIYSRKFVEVQRLVGVSV